MGKRGRKKNSMSSNEMKKVFLSPSQMSNLYKREAVEMFDRDMCRDLKMIRETLISCIPKDEPVWEPKKENEKFLKLMEKEITTSNLKIILLFTNYISISNSIAY